MTINIICSVIKSKNKLAIGKNGSLIIPLKEDLKFFKNVTENSLSCESKLDSNIVLMGKKTWLSIPSYNKPLSKRISLILTRDKILLKNQIKKLEAGCEYFVSLKQFDEIYKKYNPNVFVIGGSEIYDIFMDKSDNIYMTEINGYNSKKNGEPDVFIKEPSEEYKLISYSEKYKSKKHDVTYRILKYKRYKNYKSQENKYLDLVNEIIKTGKERTDRTGVGTYSKFGTSIRYNIEHELPLMTTKKVNFKNIIEELLWICRGDTDANILKEKAVKIWNGNTTREFLDNRGLNHYKEGVAGPVYGWQLRFWDAEYSQAFADTKNIDKNLIRGGTDQLSYVENLLKTDPMSRRILFNLWNPGQLSEMALPPCHILYMWYVEIKDNKKYLNAQLVMRSNDFFLAGCYNNVTISVLTMILALKCGMIPGEIVHTTNDCHVYKNHIDQARLQTSRSPRPLPKLRIDESVKDKSWENITADDFEVIGYFPHPFIKADMAV
jgi:dihydrofolate reductase/thymidylate synthase